MNEVLIMLDFLLGLIIGRSNPNQCFTDKKYNKYLENQRRIKEEAFRQREEKERKEREERLASASAERQVCRIGFDLYTYQIRRRQIGTHLDKSGNTRRSHTWQQIAECPSTSFDRI